LAHGCTQSDNAENAAGVDTRLSEERIGFLADVLRWPPTEASPAPRSDDQDRAIGAGADAAGPLKGPSLVPCVLLVVDEDAARDQLMNMLGKRYRVTAVAGEHGALRAIHHVMPDLVLADTGRSPERGPHLVRALRASLIPDAIPVMLLSTDGSDAARIAAFEAGAVDFLARPFSTREIVARIAAHMALHQLRREVAELQEQQQQLTETARANAALRAEVAERRRIELALNLQIQVLNNIPAVAWTATPDGQLDFINQFFLDTTGLTVEECLAPASAWKTQVDTLPPFLSGLHPDHVGRVAKAFWDGLRSGSGWTFEAPFLYGNGHYRWRLDRAVPLNDARGQIVRFVGSSVDIDELRRAQEALQLSEKRARLIVDSALDAVITIEGNGHITTWNGQAEQVFGWTAAEAVGQPISELIIPSGQRHLHLQGLHRFLQTGEGPILNRRIETMALHRDGHIFPVELTVAPIRLQQGWTFSAFIRDLTAAKAKERVLRETQAELARVSRMTMTGGLAAWIAHEVNQPLSAVVSNGQTCLHWLSEHTLDLAKARAAAERIVRDARLSADVVYRVRAMATKREPEHTQLDINDVVNDVIMLLESSLQAHTVSVIRELSTDVPALLGDRVQLQQVVLNLIVNAVEAMSSVTSRPRTLRIQSRREGADSVVVSIHDTGEGIEAQAVNKMFDPFFTTKQSGMGIGLSICRTIVEAHSGRLWASQGRPSGAVFQFVLPAEPDRIR
jgi:PAS domain S-box-containing protein